MFNIQRLRFQALISPTPSSSYCIIREVMMLGNERFHAYETNASSPSLRAHDSDILRTFGVLPGGAPPMQPEQDSANVKVVVRVRRFVQRGKQSNILFLNVS
jgi:hypothetical protein